MLPAPKASSYELLTRVMVDLTMPTAGIRRILAHHRTEQRKLRGEIRNLLGSTTAPLPDIDHVVRAVARLNRLLYLVSDGKKSLQIQPDPDGYYEDVLRAAREGYDWS